MPASAIPNLRTCTSIYSRIWLLSSFPVFLYKSTVSSYQFLRIKYETSLLSWSAIRPCHTDRGYGFSLILRPSGKVGNKAGSWATMSIIYHGGVTSWLLLEICMLKCPSSRTPFLGIPLQTPSHQTPCRIRILAKPHLQRHLAILQSLIRRR